MKKALLPFISICLIIFHYLSFRFIIKNNSFKYGSRFLPLLSRIIIKGQDNHIILGDDVKIANTKISIFGSNNRLHLQDGVKIYEECEFLIEGNNCEIFIGNKTTIGSANIFCGESNTKILIGENCMLSRSINIDTSDFHSIIDLISRKRINPPKNVLIGNKVWIGFNTTISKGAIIGQNSIIASRALVGGKEFPSNVIVAGIPAKIIKENITWSRDKLPY